MKNIIIYGGAFNPPTLAHESIILSCFDIARRTNAEIWIIPSGNRSDKIIQSDRYTRLAYLDAMITSLDQKDIPVEVLTHELDRDIDVETYDTVLELQLAHPNMQFHWVFGIDSVDSMGQWKNGHWLLQNLNILAVKRNGAIHTSPAVNISYINVDVPNISSTEVRQLIAKNQPIDGLVSKPVRKVIKNTSLF